MKTLFRKRAAIDEMEIVTIGGSRQVLYSRGEDRKNPVILFIHGGPGSPMMPFLHRFQYSWEKEFTVVQWDQRLAGKTFFENGPSGPMEALNFERVVQDGLEVAQYLLKKFAVDRLIVLGHSWGTVLGAALVQKYPHYFSAFISIGQLVNNQEAAAMGLEAARRYAKEHGLKRDLSKLERIENPWHVRPYLAKYKMAEDISLRLIFFALTTPYYRFRDLRYLLDKQRFSYHQPLYDFLETFHIRQLGVDYRVPVFYLMGENDYQTPYPLARDFFEELTAPVKTFYTLRNTAHLPMFDANEEVLACLVQIKSQL